MFIFQEFEEEYIGHVYMKSLKRIHRTCLYGHVLYEEFEENT